MEKVSEKKPVLKICLPENELTKMFIDESKYDKTKAGLIKTRKNDSIKYLLNNRCDIALVTPLDYGLAQKNADIRLLGTPVLFSEDYTRLFGIEFKPGVKKPTTVGSDIPDAFILGIAKVLFSERYGFDLKDFVIDNEDPDVMIKFNTETVSDMSEDWFETFKIPVPLYLWVLRAEESSWDADELKEIISLVTDTTEKEVRSEDGLRMGKITFTWEEKYEKAFDETLETLFYHGILPEIFAAKKFGDDIITSE